MTQLAPKSLLARLRHTFQCEPASLDELHMVLNKACNQGLFDNDALQMIQGVLRVADMTVADVMIPRTQMAMLDVSLNVHDAIPLIINSTHSRLPLFDSTSEKVTGIVLAKDILAYAEKSELAPSLSELARPATFIPDSKRLNILLREFRLKHNHMAIVIDEYGNVDGLVTIEDVLEQIVGDIEDEHDVADQTAPFIQQVDTQVAIVNALTPIDEFNDYFEMNLSDEDCDTIGGIILQAFSHLPREGEVITISDLQFTVLKATQRGITSLRVYRESAQPSQKEH